MRLCGNNAATSNHIIYLGLPIGLFRVTLRLRFCLGNTGQEVLVSFCFVFFVFLELSFMN